MAPNRTPFPLELAVSPCRLSSHCWKSNFLSVKSKPSLLRKSSSVDRLRGLARSAPQRVEQRKREIADRSQKIRDLDFEMRMIKRERQTTYPEPYDSKYDIQRKRKRQKQIDAELKRLRSQYNNLRKTAREEASRHTELMKQSQL